MPRRKLRFPVARRSLLSGTEVDQFLSDSLGEGA